VYAGGLEGSGSASGLLASGAGSCERELYAGGSGASAGAGADLVSRDLEMNEATGKPVRVKCQRAHECAGARARRRRPRTHLQIGQVVLRSKHALHMMALVQQGRLTVPQVSMTMGTTHAQQMPLARSRLLLLTPDAMVRMLPHPALLLDDQVLCFVVLADEEWCAACGADTSTSLL